MVRCKAFHRRAAPIGGQVLFAKLINLPDRSLPFDWKYLDARFWSKISSLVVRMGTVSESECQYRKLHPRSMFPPDPESCPSDSEGHRLAEQLSHQKSCHPSQLPSALLRVGHLQLPSCLVFDTRSRLGTSALMLSQTRSASIVELRLSCRETMPQTTNMHPKMSAVEFGLAWLVGFFSRSGHKRKFDPDWYIYPQFGISIYVVTRHEPFVLTWLGDHPHK